MGLPAGVIILWSGSIVSIPAGYVICDGNNGTPDLRDKFVPGAGSSYAPGDTGGAATHQHAFTSDAHFHTLQIGSAMLDGNDRAQELSLEVVTGNTNAGSSLPSYYALAYIMKT